MTEVIQYNTRDMLEALRIITPPSTFLMDKLVKRTTEHATQFIEIDTVRGGHRLAAYVTPEGDANVVTKPGYNSKIHTIPYTREKMVLTPKNLETRLPGQTIYSAGSPAQRRDQMLGEWLMQLDERIIRLEEKQLADAITNGTAVISGDGVNYTVDYGRNANNTLALTGGAKWDQTSTRDIPLNMRNAAAQMITPGVDGGYPTIAIFGVAAGDYYISDAAVRARLDNRRMEMGAIDPRVMAAQKATFIGTFRDSGINVDCYVYNGQYINSAGTATYYINTNDVIFINEAVRVDRHYGMIANLKSGNFIGRRFPLNWVSDDGSKSFLQLESAPLVALHEPDATYRLRVA